MSESFNLKDFVTCVVFLALIGMMLILFRDVFSGFKEVSETISAMTIVYVSTITMLFLAMLKLFLR